MFAPDAATLLFVLGELPFVTGLYERARKLLDENMYVGPLPITLEYYIESVAAQCIETEKPGIGQVDEAFSDIVISEQMKRRLGPAINSGPMAAFA